MSIAPTIVYYGQAPSTIVMQSSTNFDGTVELNLPAIAPGLYTFPAQTGGGLYNFHDLVGTQEAIQVLSIAYVGGGTLTVKRLLSTATGTPSVTVGTITGTGDLAFNPGDLTLSPGEDLIFTSAGATNPVIAVTAMLARSCWLA